MTPNAPQHAVILAAGFGSRLRPLTDLRPKPLVEVNGVPILYNTLKNLEAVGVQDVTIVVGYRKDAIQYACGRRFGNLKINYVESTVFDRTGSAYSLWLAREVLLAYGDCYLLEADVFFEEEALRRLTLSEAQNAAAVAPFTSSMEGSAVTLSGQGLISAVKLGQTAAHVLAGGAELFKTMNLMRFSGSTLREMVVPALDELVGSGATQAYIEQILALLIDKRSLQLTAIRCDDLRWYEIDNTDDLHTAEALFASAL